MTKKGEPVPLLHGGYYHVYNRGINRQNLFFQQRNYHHFLKLYAKHILPIADTFAYCLLPNHFHVLVRIKSVEELTNLTDTAGLSDLERPPSKCFSNLFNAYTKAVNNAYQRTGSLFERPFERNLVTDEKYFIRLILYIHQNPQKHGLVDNFRDWPYSSYGAFLSTKPTHLKRDEVWQWFDGPAGLEKLHQESLPMKDIEPLVVDDFD